jgi:hypothetical protein
MSSDQVPAPWEVIDDFPAGRAPVYPRGLLDLLAKAGERFDLTQVGLGYCIRRVLRQAQSAGQSHSHSRTASYNGSRKLGPVVSAHFGAFLAGFRYRTAGYGVLKAAKCPLLTDHGSVLRLQNPNAIAVAQYVRGC